MCSSYDYVLNIIFLLTASMALFRTLAATRRKDKGNYQPARRSSEHLSFLEFKSKMSISNSVFNKALVERQ